MDRPTDRGGSHDDVGFDTPSVEPPPAAHSPNLFNSLALILIGACLGVFWREVFQLTIKAIEMLGR